MFNDLKRASIAGIIAIMMAYFTLISPPVAAGQPLTSATVLTQRVSHGLVQTTEVVADAAERQIERSQAALGQIRRAFDSGERQARELPWRLQQMPWL